MKHDLYRGEWPWWHSTEIWYDEQDRRTRRRDWKVYEGHQEWEAETSYVNVGEKNLKAGTDYSTDRGVGDYHIRFDYYSDGSLKHAELKTRQGLIDLHYSQDGKLTTLEKTVEGKKSTFNYSYAEDKTFEDTVWTAKSLTERYKSFYIDSTGGFERFDFITDPENFEKIKEEGVIITTDTAIKQREFERKLTEAEKAQAFALLEDRKVTKDSTTVYGRLEKLGSHDRQIGSDARLLADGLVAVARMYEHTSWERGDAGWTIRGNGEQWTYELDGAIVDIEKEEVLKSVTLERVVRDSYDGSKDTHFLINSNMMIRTNDEGVEFFMGDKYNTVASKTVSFEDIEKVGQIKSYIDDLGEKKKSQKAKDFGAVRKGKDDFSL